MHLIGRDCHTCFQQIAMVDSVTGEILNRRLDHGTGEAHQFYAVLPAPARIGMEATGRTHWFERMLAEKAGWRLPRSSTNSFLSLLLHNFRASAFARNAYGLAPLMGEFSDSFLTVVAAMVMLYGLRSLLLRYWFSSFNSPAPR